MSTEETKLASRVVHKTTVIPQLAAMGLKLLLPTDHKIVHVGMQNDMIALWYETGNPKACSKIWVQMFGTGHAISDERLMHQGTVFIQNLVLHVYTRILIDTEAEV